MKCTCCGQEVSNKERFCPNCGENNENFVEEINAQQNNSYYNNQSIHRAPINPTNSQSNTNSTTNLYVYSQTNVVANKKKDISSSQKAAKVFMIIGTVASVLYLFPLIWTIPMTVSYCNKINSGEKVSIGFKICALIFVNTIAGILMLCDNND